MSTAPRTTLDLGAAVHAGMVVIGEKLGLYKALAEGALTSVELAAKTRTHERYVREWLGSQAAGGYVTYDEKSNTFSLSEEQAFALAKELARPIWRWGFAWVHKPESNAFRDVVAQAGFTRFRRATETPFNIVYEARP